MMSNKKGKNSSTRTSRKSDPLVMARFIEELSWVLDTYKDLDFKALSKVRNDLIHSKPQSTLGQNITNNTDVTKTLVGTLPGLLADNKLFSNNESISEFSQKTLGIDIPRWNKKSRNELIGHIVCNTENANQKDLEKVVKALNRLLDSSPAERKKVEADVKSGLSWNEVIQSLLH